VSAGIYVPCWLCIFYFLQCALFLARGLLPLACRMVCGLGSCASSPWLGAWSASLSPTPPPRGLVHGLHLGSFTSSPWLGAWSAGFVPVPPPDGLVHGLQLGSFFFFIDFKEDNGLHFQGTLLLDANISC
jgi:hypothetical protein